MKLHVVDGTFELFRCWFGAPKYQTSDGREVGAVRGLLRTLLRLLSEEDTTHVGVAYDRVIESFRNELFLGYKTGQGIDPALLAQFPLAEQATRCLGIVVWPMVNFEADDALAAAAWRWVDEVEQVQICSPDKDLAQCVRGDRIVLRDRIRKRILDEAGVLEKFGVSPSSIPDWLALVGDNADGIPGIPKWGAKSASTLLHRYGSIDQIPLDPADWDVRVRGATSLATNLNERRGNAALYKTLATLRDDVPLPQTLDDLEWRGPKREALEDFCAGIEDDDFVSRIPV